MLLHEFFSCFSKQKKKQNNFQALRTANSLSRSKITLCLNSSTTLWKRLTVMSALSVSWKIIDVDLGTTISVNVSYLACQSLIIFNGTTTSKVVKYSESSIKCSFFTKSPRFRVINDPLCFFSILCRLVFKAL